MSEEKLRQQLEYHKQLIDRWTELSTEAEGVFDRAVVDTLIELDRLPVEQRTSEVLLSLLVTRGKHYAQDISQQGHDLVLKHLGLLEQHVRDLQRLRGLPDISNSPKDNE